ncbi:hypothetical protein Pstr01_38920 [Pseudomonas straminea]|nr:hypothetical protein Pstr01_38920 [Pseudomonas straminea]
MSKRPASGILRTLYTHIPPGHTPGKGLNDGYDSPSNAESTVRKDVKQGIAVARYQAHDETQ